MTPSIETNLKVKSKLLVPVAIVVAGGTLLAAAAVGFLQIQKASKKSPVVVKSFSITVTAPTYELTDPVTPQLEKSLKAVTVKEAPRYTDTVGRPRLPLLEKAILLPPDVEVKNVRVVVNEQKVDVLSAKLAPVQPVNVPTKPETDPAKLAEQLKSGKDAWDVPPIPKDQATYDSSTLYPATNLIRSTTDQWGAYDTLMVVLALYRYAPKTDTLMVTQRATVTVSYTQKAAKLKQREKYARPAILAEAKEHLANPEMLEPWYGNLATQNGIQSVQSPTDIDLAIVRPETFWAKQATHAGGQAIFGTDGSHIWHAGVGDDGRGWNNLAYYNGSTWSTASIPSTFTVESLNGLTDGTVVAAGTTATTAAEISVHRTGTSATFFQSVNLSGITSTSHLYDVRVVNSTLAWAVGSQNNGTQGLLLRATSTTPVFSQWQTVPLPANTPTLRAVYPAGATSAWAVGDAGTILYYNGATWAKQTSGITVNLNDIDGSGPTDVWAVGANRTILHYNGSVWQDLSSTNPDLGTSTSDVLMTVKVGDATHRWIAGGGILLQWDSATNTWLPGYLEREENIQLMGHIPEVTDIAMVQGVVYIAQGPRILKGDTASTLLDEYVSYRTSQGYHIEVETLPQIWSLFRTQVSGKDDVLASVRSYLLDRYTNNGLRYVMIVGSVDSIPGAWGRRGGSDDNLRNLYGDAFGELRVARIPLDDPPEIADYLQRVITFEARNDTYLQNALVTAGYLGYVPEERDLLEATGYTHVQTWKGDSEGVISRTPFVLIRDLVNQYWPTQHPAFVSMAGHGSVYGPSGQLDVSELTPFLDNAYASHVFIPISCSTAVQTFFYSTGSALIQRGGISYVGAIGPVIAGVDDWQHFVYLRRFLADHQSTAEAFTNANWWSKNVMILYGDPLIGSASPYHISFSNPVSTFSTPFSEGVYRATPSIDIVGSVLGAGFSSYSIDWGQGRNPTSWSTSGITLTTPNEPKVIDSLGTWNVAGITTAGLYTLRITAIYNGQPKSHQITIAIDNQVCSDSTQPQTCSTTKPKWCENGELINKCQTCGCPNASYTCMQSDGSCFPGCTDGTPTWSCSTDNTRFCNGTNTLFQLPVQCASSDGVAHTTDDCNYCGAHNSTYCAGSGLCSTPTAGYGLYGDYYQGDNFQTLVNQDVLDAVIDFGLNFGGTTYFADLLSRPDRANTTGYVSVRWDGYVNIPTSSSITYYLSCRGHCRLYVENLATPLVDISDVGEGSRTLAPGWHPIRVEFRKDSETFGNPGIQLGWKVNGGSYVDEMGGMMFGIPVSLIIPHQSLVPKLSGGGGSGGKEQVTPGDPGSYY